MGKTLIRIAAGLLLILGTAACNQTGTEDSSGETAIYSYSANKVYLDEAMLEQLAPHASECQGHKRCVTICHRPPGNPDNCKSKQLPVQAIAAHLNHGGSQHTDHDYVGPCHDDSEGGGGETGGDDDGEEGGGGTEEGGGDVGTGGTVIPPWCEPYIEIDSNCDGIIDSTGDPLL